MHPSRLPTDASVLAKQNEHCHCVADAELDNRYNVLRAEEHARQEGKCGPQWSTDVANFDHNRERNRYASVVPWDHSRVLLPVNDGENDYINASWVELGSRTYIAAQGPLPSTVNDFWQMVYAYGGDPAIVIMLTALHEHSVEKCAKYWPDTKGTPLAFPKERGFKFGLTVTLEKKHAKHEQYKWTTFTLTPSDPNYPPKTVQHIYYHTWLDLSKPNADADIRALIHLVNNELRNPAAPQIVHCSAGIGRTGTFIAIDALLSTIDVSIRPGVMPKIVPLWKGDTRVLEFRKNPFTGATDHRGSLAGKTQLLSKFDISQATNSNPPSLMAIPPGSGVNSRVASRTNSLKGSNNLPGNSNGMSTQFEADEEEIPPEQVIDDDEAAADTLASVRSTHTHDTEVPIPEDTPDFYDAESTQETKTPSDVNKTANGNGTTADRNQQGSAKSGPVIKKVKAKITSVDNKVFLESPNKVDVLRWFDDADPVMSTVRTMRKQRPKMVQGKQQLGYIYDQFEVGQQLARVTDQANPKVDPPIVRRSTVTSVPHHDLSTTTRKEPKKPKRLFSFQHFKSNNSQVPSAQAKSRNEEHARVASRSLSQSEISPTDTENTKRSDSKDLASKIKIKALFSNNSLR